MLVSSATNKRILVGVTAKMARYSAFRKLWFSILPIETRGGIPYLTRGLQSVSQVGGVNSHSKIIKTYNRKLFECIMALISSTYLNSITTVEKEWHSFKSMASSETY